MTDSDGLLDEFNLVGKCRIPKLHSLSQRTAKKLDEHSYCHLHSVLVITNTAAVDEARAVISHGSHS